MAYMNQKRKQELAPAIREICRRWGIKATLAVRNHMTLVLNIREGKIDFIGNHLEVEQQRQHLVQKAPGPVKDHIAVNTYCYRDNFTGDARDFLHEVIAAMNQGNHDRSDPQTDYFDVGWYIDINIGDWDRAYRLINSN